ncbi:MAG TPA: helix-turn-helix domain-containing protein [Rhizomicrobium sp.]
MIYETWTPPAPLDRFIQCLWYWETDDPPGYAKDTIMASASMGILINLREDELRWYGGEDFAAKNTLRGIALCGTHAENFAIDALQPRMMGVRFQPGGAWPFFGPTGVDFYNSHISLEDFWGNNRARSLHAQLVETKGIAAKFNVLLGALLQHAPRPLEHSPAVSMALSHFDRAPLSSRVKKTADDADLSQKKFIRHFTQEVGFTPKLYLRVVRFQKLLEKVWQMPTVDWAPLAAAHGYYDQPHLIRDFREFCGFTPTQYLARRGPYQQHLPLPE